MKKTSHAVVSFDYGRGACSEEPIDESARPLYDPILFVVAAADPMRATMQQEQRRCRSCSSGGAAGAKDQDGGPEAEGHGSATAAPEQKRKAKGALRRRRASFGADPRWVCGDVVLPLALNPAECLGRWTVQASKQGCLVVLVCLWFCKIHNKINIGPNDLKLVLLDLSCDTLHLKNMNTHATIMCFYL